MVSKNIKTHFDGKVYVTFFLIFITGIILLLWQNSRKYECDNVDFDIIANTFYVGNLIEFQSLSKDAYKWEWDFGDHSGSEYRSNVIHQYIKPGKYDVSLKVNGVCHVKKEVEITKEVIKKTITPEFSIPKVIRVGEAVQFHDLTREAKSWQWRFGENMSVDATGKDPIYAFKTPGEKVVSLVVNDDIKNIKVKRVNVLTKKRPVRRRQNRVEIMDPVTDVISNAREQEPEEPEIQKIEISNKEFEQLLVGYSEGTVDFNKIRGYLCNDSKNIIKNGGVPENIYEFCYSIQEKKIKISRLELTRGNTGCISFIKIDVKIRNTIFGK